MGWFVPLAPSASTEFVHTFLDPNLNYTWFASNFMYPPVPGGLPKQVRQNFDHYSRIGVRFFTAQISPVADALNADGVERVKLVYTDPTTNVKIYENPSAIPRLALVTSSGRIVGHPISFDVRANSVRARYETPAPGFLVLTDAMLPGWTATLNGKPVPIHAMDGVFRAIRIDDAGVHDVTFSYRPRFWSASLWLAAIGCGALVYKTRRSRVATAQRDA
jgi:hypothetical protein